MRISLKSILKEYPKQSHVKLCYHMNHS